MFLFRRSHSSYHATLPRVRRQFATILTQSRLAISKISHRRRSNLWLLPQPRIIRGLESFLESYALVARIFVA